MPITYQNGAAKSKEGGGGGTDIHPFLFLIYTHNICANLTKG